MDTLRSRAIKLAYENPEIRPLLLPILKSASISTIVEMDGSKLTFKGNGNTVSVKFREVPTSNGSRIYVAGGSPLLDELVHGAVDLIKGENSSEDPMHPGYPAIKPGKLITHMDLDPEDWMTLIDFSKRKLAVDKTARDFNLLAHDIANNIHDLLLGANNPPADSLESEDNVFAGIPIDRSIDGLAEDFLQARRILALDPDEQTEFARVLREKFIKHVRPVISF